LQKLGTKRIETLELTHMTYILKTLGLYDVAIKEAEEALKITPDDSESFRFLGMLYQIKGDYRRSFENFRLAAILRPYDFKIRIKLAESYEYLKDYKGAKEQYDRAIENGPGKAKPYFGLARVYILMGQDRKAADAIKQALTLDPEDKVAVKKIRDIIKSKKQSKNSAYLPVIQESDES
jgi:tetratricopeptide (TPR) repeat protein